MAYRDENEALRARIEQLERENDELRRERAQLRAPLRTTTTGERLLGAPLVLIEEREIEGALPASAHEEVLETLRAAFGAIGDAQSVGQTLTWRLGPPAGQRIVEVIVTSREGRTRVRVLERLGGLAGGLFGGIVGGAGAGGAAVIAPLLALVDPVLAFVSVPLWIAAVHTLVRAGYESSANARARELDGLTKELERVVRHRVAQDGPRVRVDATERDDEAEQARTAGARRAT
ncbi:hypothetical protein [Sandaracinus amylolyticus]|uniref:hypothetical protein n=1 Tax=Sandaracinus amylolyticus TaxID=927083 RepID=UPI001F2C2F95|nr:hypothetical protein [Sandaracinus amylolyticus]UJR84808.1 Hypothetical protein I5071_68870 [Sandaracinus amylolyticus]